jgi:hypothetical protein
VERPGFFVLAAFYYIERCGGFRRRAVFLILPPPRTPSRSPASPPKAELLRRGLNFYDRTARGAAPELLDGSDRSAQPNEPFGIAGPTHIVRKQLPPPGFCKPGFVGLHFCPYGFPKLSSLTLAPRHAIQEG